MSKRKWEDLVVGTILCGLLWLGGCANGGGGVSVRELAFAARVALVLDGDPTTEEIAGLVETALQIAESRGVEPANLEYARVLAQVVVNMLESEGDWRAALVDLLAAIEVGENE